MMISAYRPKCLNDGCPSPVTDNGSKLRPFCKACHTAGPKRLSARPGVRPFKTGRCQNDGTVYGFPCGWDYSKTPQAVGRTQIDHLDGDCTNNNPANCLEVCGNCHEIKSELFGDRRRKGGAKYAAAMAARTTRPD